MKRVFADTFYFIAFSTCDELTTWLREYMTEGTQ